MRIKLITSEFFRVYTNFVCFTGYKANIRLILLSSLFLFFYSKFLLASSIAITAYRRLKIGFLFFSASISITRPKKSVFDERWKKKFAQTKCYQWLVVYSGFFTYFPNLLLLCIIFEEQANINWAPWRMLSLPFPKLQSNIELLLTFIKIWENNWFIWRNIRVHDKIQRFFSLVVR